MTAAGVIIALLAPITGQRADRSGKGVRVLGWFSLLVFISLALMFFVYPGSPLGPIGALWLGIGLLGIGNVFFEFASVNYNAMLNDLSTPKNRGAISGLGWGAGYIGGIVLLLFLYSAIYGIHKCRTATGRYLFLFDIFSDGRSWFPGLAYEYLWT